VTLLVSFASLLYIFILRVRLCKSTADLKRDARKTETNENLTENKVHPVHACFLFDDLIEKWALSDLHLLCFTIEDYISFMLTMRNIACSRISEIN